MALPPAAGMMICNILRKLAILRLVSDGAIVTLIPSSLLACSELVVVKPVAAVDGSVEGIVRIVGPLGVPSE